MTYSDTLLEYRTALRWALIVLSHPRRNSSPEAIEAEKREVVEFIRQTLEIEVKEPTNGQ